MTVKDLSKQYLTFTASTGQGCQANLPLSHLCWSFCSALENSPSACPPMPWLHLILWTWVVPLKPLYYILLIALFSNKGCSFPPLHFHKQLITRDQTLCTQSFKLNKCLHSSLSHSLSGPTVDCAKEAPMWSSCLPATQLAVLGIFPPRSPESLRKQHTLEWDHQPQRPDIRNTCPHFPFP